MRVLLVAIVLFALVTTIAAQFNFGNVFGTAAAFLGAGLIGNSLRQGLGFNGGGGFFNGGGGFFNGGQNSFDLEPVNLVIPNGGFNGFNGRRDSFF